MALDRFLGLSESQDTEDHHTMPVPPATSDDLKSWEAVLMVKRFVTISYPVITNVLPSLPSKWVTKGDTAREGGFASLVIGCGFGTAWETPMASA